MTIHGTAIVDPKAELGRDVEVGPYCILGEGVRVGDRTRLLSHVVMSGDTHLGEDSIVFPHAVIGGMPQDKKLRSEDYEGRLRIGNHNQIREHVTIHGGTPYGGGITTVGDENMLLVGSHVGHDSKIGSHIVFTNGAMAAGHTVVQDYAILGAMVGIHQFARIGRYAMIGAGAMLSKDAPPFSLVQGDRARLISVNVVGLRRNGFDGEQVAMIKRCYRKLFWRAGTLAERLASITELAKESDVVREVLEFVDASKRGIVMPRGKHEPIEERPHD